jgi:hypothetical protein
MSGSGTGKTVKLEISVWWDAEDQMIHLASKEPKGFISTVGNDRDKTRGHPHLFSKLTEVLRDAGAPAPE